MELLRTRFQNKPFLVYDKHYQPQNNLDSFADTNALLRLCDALAQPLIHFWTLDQTMILGMMDTKLPFFAKGLTSLKQADYHYFIRNSGGLAVASDTGILNVSLFLPNFKSESIETAYQQMVQWVQTAFQTPEHKIDVYEITHSYCPGSFDLSIHGQKFGGISQRRVHQSVAVMLYLSINGDQFQRSQTLQSFYQQGLQKQATKWNFPTIDPKVMANLDSLLNTALTIRFVKRRLLAVFEQNHLLNHTQTMQSLIEQPEYQAYFQHALTQLKQRNQKDLPN